MASDHKLMKESVSNYEELAPSIFYTSIHILYKTIKKMLPYCTNTNININIIDLHAIFSKIADIKKMRAPNNYIIYLISEGHILACDVLNKMSKYLMIDISDEAMYDRYNSRSIHTDIDKILKSDIKTPTSLRYTIRTSDYIGGLFKGITTAYCKCKALIKEHKSNLLLKEECIKEHASDSSFISKESKLGSLIYERIKKVLKTEIVCDLFHELICNEYYICSGDINALIIKNAQHNKKLKGEILEPSSIISAFKPYVHENTSINTSINTTTNISINTTTKMSVIEPLESAMNTISIRTNKSNSKDGIKSLKRPRE